MAVFGGDKGNTDKRFEELKQKYASALRTIEQQGVRLAHLHVQDNKLYLNGQAPSEEAKNKVWDQIKLVDPNYSDIIADITAEAGSQPAPAASASHSAGGQTYTVQSGDTLSKISKQHYGDANQYMLIFNANQDKLTDPDKIQPGQVLTIPPR